MTAVLARRYQWLLRAYPVRFRRRYGDEILDTLMERSRPGQRWPSIAEVSGLLHSAAAVRLGVTGRRDTAQTWIGALHLSAVFLLGWALRDPVLYVINPEWGHLRGGVLFVGLGVLALVAVVRGWLVAALGLTVGWLVIAERREGVPDELLLAMVVLLILSAMLRGRYARLHTCWLLVAPLLVVDNLGFMYTYIAVFRGVDLFGIRLLDGLYLPSFVVLVLLTLALAVDPRLGLVGAILALGGELTYVEIHIPYNPFNGFGLHVNLNWQSGTSALLMLVLGIAGHLLTRRLNRT